jgi:hypothetical protein
MRAHRDLLDLVLVLLLSLAAGQALAQSSASYSVSDHTLNAGGHPQQGQILFSASFRVSLDALGEAVTGHGLSSASSGSAPTR